MKNRFRIIIPAYNCEKYVKRCIWSVVNQKFLHNEYEHNYSAVFIDDCSTDNTFSNVELAIKQSGEHKLNFRFFRRNKNVGALENIVYGINSVCFEDEDIIVLLDGDDALISSDVIDYLDQIYQDPKIWLTYGQYKNESNGKIGNNLPLTIPTREYRCIQNGSLYWCTSHLRTFKYKIWKRIQDIDLRDSNGKYFVMAWDMAIMYPLIEMSGNERIKYVDKVLYLYNDLNPINDFKKNQQLQILTANFIKRKLRYRMLRDDEV
jgi:glycosyltransferase involved in cell wall biosynthesis